MNSNFLKNKSLVRCIAVIILAILVFSVIFFPEKFNSYANGILVIVTAVYAYLTYEILLSTRQSRILPYVNVEFILVSKLDESFIKQNGAFLRRTDRLNKLQQDLARPEYKMNAVLVKVENISETTAVNVSVKTAYQKQSLSEIINSDKQIAFGTLKKGESAIDIVEVFEAPSNSDYFRLRDGIIEFTDINGQYEKDPLKKNVFSNTAKTNNFHEDIDVVFSLKINS